MEENTRSCSQAASVLEGKISKSYRIIFKVIEFMNISQRVRQDKGMNNLKMKLKIFIYTNILLNKILENKHNRTNAKVLICEVQNVETY